MHNGGQDSAAALDAHGGFKTVRRELREWICDDADRILSWGPETEVGVAYRMIWELCSKIRNTPHGRPDL